MSGSGTKRLRGAAAGLAIMFACQAALGAVVCPDSFSPETQTSNKLLAAALLEAAVDASQVGGMVLPPITSPAGQEQDRPHQDDPNKTPTQPNSLLARAATTPGANAQSPTGSFGPLNPAMSSSNSPNHQPPLTAALPREGKILLPASPLFGLFRPPQGRSW